MHDTSTAAPRPVDGPAGGTDPAIEQFRELGRVLDEIRRALDGELPAPGDTPGDVAEAGPEEEPLDFSDLPFAVSAVPEEWANMPPEPDDGDDDAPAPEGPLESGGEDIVPHRRGLHSLRRRALHARGSRSH